MSTLPLARWFVPEFVPVDLGSFPADRPPLVDLYHFVGGRYTLYCRAGALFTERARLLLRKCNVRELYIRLGGGATGAGVLDAPHLLSLLELRFPSAVKASLLYSGAIATARAILSAPHAPENLAAARHLATTIATHLARNPESFLSIAQTMRHDFSVYTHAVNVCAYAAALGHALNLTQDDLLELSLAALLHDVGKTKVPPAILNKPESLTEEEWTTIRRHPEWSVQLLGTASPNALAVQTVILQHHERSDGLGYPHGLKSVEIHPLARFVAMADAYDALTCSRTYRESRAPFEALRTIREQLAGPLDRTLFVAFVRLLGRD
jgi:HD-GYP domain-containing protein (c-di-GMP phosphodiesterase class II)